jgi:transcriptional regulator with XRE-family HTH domain
MTTRFGRILKEWRVDKHCFTQQKLAEELRVTSDNERYNKSDISKWERGHRVPPEHVVETLEKVLEISDHLLIKAAGYGNENLPRAGVAKQTETSVSMRPSTRQLLNLPLLANTILIESIRVVAAEECRFRFAMYDSVRQLEVDSDPYGHRLEDDCVIGPIYGWKKVSYKPERADIYIDKDNSRLLHCDISYLEPPIRFDLNDEELREYQKNPVKFTVTLVYRVDRSVLVHSPF